MDKLADRTVLRIALLLCVLAAAGFVVLGRGFPAGSPGVVDLQLAFTPDRFAGIVQQWGPSGVYAYLLSTRWIDSWFPFAYALLLSSLMSMLATRADGQCLRLGHATIALPWLAMVLDWLENTLHLILLRDPANLSATGVLVASVAAAIKWGLIAVTVLVLLFCLFRRWVQSGVRR